MVQADRTDELRDLLGEGKSGPSRPKSPAGSRSVSRARRGDKGKNREDEAFLKEAYRIHTHLASLSQLIHTIRKPYLSLSEPPLARRPRPPTDGIPDDDGLSRYTTSKHLTDRERDEIDLRGRMILRRCKDAVQTLEDAEKTRQNQVLPQSTWTTLLPSLAPDLDPLEPLIIAHRASVLWTLRDELAKASSALSNMQEERAKRRAERSRTLGSGAAREAAQMQRAQEARASGSFWTPKANGDPSAGLHGAIEPGIEEQLPPELVQQLEQENNALLEHMESTLTSVLAAEKSLLEISQLQTELISHLVQQTELTDKLYDEAVGSVSEVGRANEQLKKAKERSGEARFLLLMFLIGASLALLFLDWYS